MLERCRRSQSRFEPIGGVPATRTTRTRRTRRLCVNIEANDGGSLRSRRRRRSALPDPYFMSYPPVYEANPWMCRDWGSNEQFYSYGNFVNPENRLYAGGEYECAPVNGFMPPEYVPSQEFYGNNSDQKAGDDLRNILAALDGYLEEDSNTEPENYVEPGNYVDPDPTGGPDDTQSTHNNQLSAILDRICDTMGRLNNYMTAKSNNHEQMNIQMRPLPQPVQVLQLPVQPLILPPMPITNSNLCSNNPYAMEPEPCPTQSRTLFERVPWLKERKRKRPPRSVSHVLLHSQSCSTDDLDRLPWLKERKRKRPPRSISHVLLHSQSCSTDDLDRLPRVLEASSSRESRVPMRYFSPPMRDSSTTMWSPMKFYCTASPQEQETPYKDLRISSPMTMMCDCRSLFRPPEEEKSFQDFYMPPPMAIRSPMNYSSSVSTQEQEKSLEDFKMPPPMEIRSPMKYGSSVSTQEQEKCVEDFKMPSPLEIRSPMKYSSSVSAQKQEKHIDDYKIPSPRTMRCKKRSGLVRPLKNLKLLEDIKIPSPLSVSDPFPSSLLRAPPPSMKSEDDLDKDHELDRNHRMDRNHEMDKNHEMDLYRPPSESNCVFGASPQTSSYGSSCDYHRSVGSNLLYSYVEEEKEEKLHLEAGEEHVDEDEWYQGASQRLAELELEQEYFLELQQQSQVSTRDQQQQTDHESATNINIRVTTDKAVSTTDIDGVTNREPVKIVRVYKRSSLKPKQWPPSNSQRRKTKDNHKVKFEREQKLPSAPEIITIGRYPMECEDTARTIHKRSRKIPERITIGKHQQDIEDTGRSINRSRTKRSSSTEKRTYRDQ